MHDSSKMITAARSLRGQMIAAGLLSATETSGRLDILIAKLDVDNFLSLRALPAFWELLSLWQVSADIEQPPMPQMELDAHSAVNDHQDLAPSDQLLSSQIDEEEEQFSTADVPHCLPHPRTLVVDVRLGGRFDKLIARLCRSANRSAGVEVTIETLEDILNLPVESLLKLDGVGKSYREAWQELKDLYTQATEFLPESKDISETVEPLDLVKDDMRLNLTQLDAAELKAIAKLERIVGRADIRGILSFDSLEQGGKSSVSGRTRSQLLQVRERLVSQLQQIAAGSSEYHATSSSLIFATAQTFDSVAELGDFLLVQTDSFLAALDEKSQLIFQHRWGFVDERLTLSEIGQKYAVSRERIRQLESKINERLNNYLALNSADIWCAATSLPLHELRLEMADLSGCFAESNHFHDFLEFVSHGHIASARETPDVSLAILDDFFAMHGAAIDHALVLKYLQQELALDEKGSVNALQFLHEQGKVTFDGDHVVPLKLGKREAAAAVLSTHPNGLPWLDIVRHANRLGISSSPFSEQAGGNALQDSELMYVAGKGVYRHTRFVDFCNFDDSEIFDALHIYFANSAREVAHLSEVHAGLPELRRHDYYILRYVVKMRGKDHGIYFNGKSQTDSVSLNAEFDLFSQKSVILEAMRKSSGPLTKNEVAQLLKSRSSKHATIYLNELMVGNQVVQVDRMLYTTSERAYENVDLESIRGNIETVLRRHDQPVDPSVIQYELNAMNGESYSKYFYSSLARYFAQLGYWQRRYSLFALRPISFANLTDAIDTFCKAEHSVEQNYQSLRQHIAITEDAARVSIYNWKASNSRISSGVCASDLDDEIDVELEID